MMRLLSKEVASVGSTSKSDDEIDEVRSVDDEEHGCAWNADDPGQCSMDEVLESTVGVGAVLANPTAFVVVQEGGTPSVSHEERITEIEDLHEEPQQTSTAFDDKNVSDGKDGAKSEHPSDGEDETNNDSSKEPPDSQESFVSEEDPVDEDAAVTRSDHSRSSRRKGRSRK